ncbi:nucleotide exchange factor GrpE [Candidatus Poriferisodalis sp.]|uniref:nucleotide exchange factor GrpE n=1 Tax=Candidatus Poriferisodalis sp. TaxID=3101277 RepID=UPI003B02A747
MSASAPEPSEPGPSEAAVDVVDDAGTSEPDSSEPDAGETDELAAATAESPSESPPDVDDLTQRADLLAQLDALTAERDEYLDQLQRQRAEFQNFRKRVEAERRQQVSAGVSRLVESLLPVLDGCDAATAQGHGEVAAVGQSLMVALGKAGLERIDAVGEPFDPNQHEAVTIEAAPEPGPAAFDDDAGASPDAAAIGADAGEPELGGEVLGGEVHQVVTAELRSGFRFDGRVLRAAMVKVRTG